MHCKYSTHGGNNASNSIIPRLLVLVLVLPVGFFLASTLGLELYDIFPAKRSVPFLRYSYHVRESATWPSNATVDLNWYPPNATSWETSVSAVINATGTYGFVFDPSEISVGEKYGVDNWCSMPHVREQEYVRPGRQYELEFVELIHRHHKRTPYASNTFPVESYAWDCSDEGLFFYGKPLNLAGKESASTYWSVYTSGSNPFEPHGFNGTCQFPQITRGGLDDSYQHGLDLLGVYHNLRGFLPKKLDESIIYRVTNNVITSQVAGMVVQAMYPSPATANIPLLVQPDSIDSLEPTYSCPTASLLYSSLGPGSSSPAWTAHLSAASSLHTKLDSVSGIPATDGAWHMSFDHYFDNLSSRLCHAKPLPCQVINGTNSTNCITHVEADEVFRLGKYEYNFLYRAAGAWTLQAARARYGVYIAEVSANIRAAIAGSSSVQYRHKIAHDGSVSLLLSILQVDVMVWPGMGAEIVFEIWSKLTGGQKKYFARVFWSGKALRSNNPALGVMDMLDVEDLLVYFDGLVGLNASKVPSLCGIISA